MLISIGNKLTRNSDIPGDAANTDVWSVHADHGGDNNNADEQRRAFVDDSEVDETHAVDDKGIVSHVFLPTRGRMISFFLSNELFVQVSILTERKYPSTAMELAVVFRQPNFHNLILHFLFDQAHSKDPDTPLGSDVPLDQLPPFDSRISVYHMMTAVFYSPSDASGLQGMRQESIRSNPCWRRRLPRYDTVFIARDPTLPGIRGFDVVQILALFSFVHAGQYFPCALVRWFSYVADEPDEVMGMWVVRPDNNADGSPSIGVIHLDSVLRAAHLIPVFGDLPMPIGLHAEQCLDVFQSFYINKYIDYHAFEITSAT